MPTLNDSYNNNTTDTTIVLWPLYRSTWTWVCWPNLCLLAWTCVCWQLQLRTEGFSFCGNNVLLPTHTLAEGNWHIQTMEKMLEFSPMTLCISSPYINLKWLLRTEKMSDILTKSWDNPYTCIVSHLSSAPYRWAPTDNMARTIAASVVHSCTDYVNSLIHSSTTRCSKKQTGF